MILMYDAPRPRLLVQVCFIPIEFGSLGASQPTRSISCIESTAVTTLCWENPNSSLQSAWKTLGSFTEILNLQESFLHISKGLGRWICRNTVSVGLQDCNNKTSTLITRLDNTQQYSHIFTCILKHHLPVRLNLLLHGIFQLLEISSCWGANMIHLNQLLTVALTQSCHHCHPLPGMVRTVPPHLQLPNKGPASNCHNRVEDVEIYQASLIQIQPHKMISRDARICKKISCPCTNMCHFPHCFACGAPPLVRLQVLHNYPVAILWHWHLLLPFHIFITVNVGGFINRL